MVELTLEQSIAEILNQLTSRQITKNQCYKEIIEAIRHRDMRINKYLGKNGYWQHLRKNSRKTIGEIVGKLKVGIKNGRI